MKKFASCKYDSSSGIKQHLIFSMANKRPNKLEFYNKLGLRGFQEQYTLAYWAHL